MTVDVSPDRVRGVSPNQPKTPMHSFRCPDDLWEQGKAAAEANGEDLAKALRRMLERYVARTERQASR